MGATVGGAVFDAPRFFGVEGRVRRSFAVRSFAATELSARVASRFHFPVDHAVMSGTEHGEILDLVLAALAEGHKMMEMEPTGLLAA